MRSGLGNLISAYGFLDKDGSSVKTAWAEENQGRMGGTPWQFRDRYIENSPVFYLDRINTPLLITHGTADTTVVPSLADEVFVGLRRLGKEVVYARYNGENHSELTWGYANQVDFSKRMIAWFDKYLKAVESSAKPQQR
jgi:dipeptidyl aminopeptidase/acylaminoacyl peptidase